MDKYFFKIGAFFGFLAVAFGAFGAHALKDTLEAAGRADTFETAVKFQFYHALALLIIGSMKNTKKLNYAAIAFSMGILLFSGSLYLLCLTSSTFFAYFTPIGGVCFLIGWGLLAFSKLS